MKSITIALMIVFLSSSAWAIPKSSESSTPGVDIVSDVVVSTEILSSDDTPMTPPVIVNDLPDIKKVMDTAEEEGVGLGTYGTIFVLLIAAVAAYVKLRKKQDKSL